MVSSKLLAVAGLALGFGVSAMAQDIRDQWDIKISKAELVFPGVAPHDAANGIKDALSQFAIPAHLSYRAMPSAPPARPGAPRLKNVSRAAPSPEYVCEDSYAEISKRPPPVQNAFAFIMEGHQACLYSFEKGVKAYVIYYSIKKTESLTSGLFNGITRAIRGSDEERAAGQLQENIDAIRAKLPGLLVERLEIPGRPPETPDLQAVAALIPPAPAVVASAPAAAAPAAGTPLQAKLEARKNLTAMGMTYHSQQQFVEAIRRKDDVAVQLFLDGGGVRADAADSEGKTPLDIAQASGGADIVALLQPKPQGPAAAVASPAAAAPEVDFSKLPADLLAQIDAEIAAQKLSPEQAAQARARLASQFLKVKAFSDALNARN